MAFYGEFSGISKTTADFYAEFTGGDTSYENYRYVKLIVGGRTYEIASDNQGGGDSYFSRTISGLSPGATYSWSAQLGYVNNGKISYLSITDSGSFTTKYDISLWSWSSSNGEATTAMTQRAYQILLGNAPASDGFSHYVWNDLVDKVVEMRGAKGYYWDTSDGMYLTSANAKVYAGETLSAAVYNAVRYNIGSVKGTGIYDVMPGNEITGFHITRLTDVLNEIISSL